MFDEGHGVRPETLLGLLYHPPGLKRKKEIQYS
jgi:hypothetical protein